MKKFAFIPLLLVWGVLCGLLDVSVKADSITWNTNGGFGSSQIANGIFYPATNTSVFTYYGFPTTNYQFFKWNNSEYPYASNTIDSYGLSSTNQIGSMPPVVTSFSFTGTNLELVIDDFNYWGGYSQAAYYTVDDGQSVLSYTNSMYLGYPNRPAWFIPIYFGSNTTHSVRVCIRGHFVGVNVPSGNTVTPQTYTFNANIKPNLLIMEGDSYTEGYDPTYEPDGFQQGMWFPGWVWQLVHMVPNTVCVQGAASSTGFYAQGNTNTQTLPNYRQRVTNDVVNIYSNALASGKYNHIFIATSGTINDLGDPTNAVYSEATNVYSILKTHCPGATIFCVGNWLGTGGSTSPQATDLELEWAMTNAAAAEGLPIFDPIPANLKNASNYNVFYPPGSTTDSVHPSAAGYQIYANFVNTNLVTRYGALWADNVGSNVSASAAFAALITNGSAPLTVQFNYTGSNGYTFSWFFGDGAVSSLPSPSHTYSSPGIYPVSLVVNSVVSNSGPLFITVTNGIIPENNNGAVSIVASPISASAPSVVTFNCSYTNASSYYWSFGDGGSSTLQSPQHLYQAAGTYTVAVIVNNSLTNTPASLITITNAVSAAASLNVTNYGAIGDLAMFTNFNTVSNSSAVVCPGANFSAKDINKIIEIFGAGNWQGASNQDLFAHISTVSSPSNITISTTAGKSAINLTGYFGTDDAIGFSNAIAACPVPTGTIIIPSGNYFLVSRNLLNTTNSASLSAVTLTRGGITFIGQGAALLKDAGGWVNENGTCIRGSLFAMQAPMTNNYPLVFTNLIMDGGVLTGNIHNLAYPPISSTGLGWDGNHHWMVAWGNGYIIDSLVMENCVIQHWRGEMMEDTTTVTNLFLTATNCAFYDGDGSCINNFAHDCESCTFSNAQQAEEFYRSYTTNSSTMANCLFAGLSAGIALNGGYYGDPNYLIINNVFTNFYGQQFPLLTTPACDVAFVSNTIYGGLGLGLGCAGYQGTTCNSNIMIYANIFNGTYTPLQIMGAPPNQVENVYFYSNILNSCSGIAESYGWSTNVFIFDNLCNGTGGLDMGSSQGQYFYDLNNNYMGYGIYSQTLTNIISYTHGSIVPIQSALPGSVFVLDDSNPSKIPPNAVFVISNLANVSFSVFSIPSMAGPAVTINPGQSIAFYWTGSSWSKTPSANAVDLSINPTQLAFSPVSLGVTETSTTMLSNGGTAAAYGTISVGPPFQLASSSYFCLLPGGLEPISVKFNPTNAGNFTQYLVLNGSFTTNILVTGMATNGVGPNAPTVSAISASLPNVGTNPSVYAVIAGPMQLSATASANSGDAISWQWLESVNGGTQTVYSTGSGPNPAASLTNSTNAGGTTNLWVLQATDMSNGLSAQSQLKLFIALPPPQGIQVRPSGPP